MNTATPMLEKMSQETRAKVIEPSIQQFCKEIVAEFARRVDGEKTDASGQQKQNAPSTIAAKRRRLTKTGQPAALNKPLVGKDRLLRNAAKYQIERVSDLEYRIKPPKGREMVVGYIQDKGYLFMHGIPDKIKGKDSFTRFTDIFQKRWKKYLAAL